MSRLIFKLNKDNTVEVMSTDFMEEYIDIKNEGDAKIVEVSVVEETFDTGMETP